MVKNFNDGFADYQAETEDDDGDKHTSTVRAHVIEDDDWKGYQVPTIAGTATLRKGDAVIETDRPGVYDVLPKDAWESTGYADKPTASKRASARKTASASQSSGTADNDDGSGKPDKP